MATSLSSRPWWFNDFARGLDLRRWVTTASSSTRPAPLSRYGAAAEKSDESSTFCWTLLKTFSWVGAAAAGEAAKRKT